MSRNKTSFVLRYTVAAIALGISGAALADDNIESVDG